MKVNVPGEVLEDAKECEYDYSCLKTGKCGEQELCKVNSADGLNILFLGGHPKCECPFKVPWGRSYICRCPVRYFLYTKYQI